MGSVDDLTILLLYMIKSIALLAGATNCAVSFLDHIDALSKFGGSLNLYNHSIFVIILE